MYAKDIGKMIADGNVLEIIIRELQIKRADAIRLWYGSDTRKKIYETNADQIQIDARQCYGELMKEQGELKEVSRIPNADKNSAFATPVAARIISTSMYKFWCDFNEIQG
jgi:hypothetical protein